MNNNNPLYQNLIDAKCSRELTQECILLASEGKSAQMMIKLNEQRKGLLDKIHEDQKALDCLDYLMFQIKKETL